MVGLDLRYIHRPKTIVTAVAPNHPDEDPVEFARRRLGFEPDPVQCEILRANAKRGMLNCSRQWGKTTVSVAKAVHRAWSRPGSLIVVASPGARQSGIWMQRAEEMLRRLGVAKKGDGYNRLSLKLPNESRIVGLPENEHTVRGYSALSMLVIDEAARVPDGMYQAVGPMLAVSGGDLWMMSTPWGKRGFFYEEWEHGGPRWMRVRAAATDCTRIPGEFLEEQRAAMRGDAFRQEFMCEFVGGGVGAFDRDLIEGALDDDIEPL